MQLATGSGTAPLFILWVMSSYHEPADKSTQRPHPSRPQLTRTHVGTVGFNFITACWTTETPPEATLQEERISVCCTCSCAVDTCRANFHLAPVPSQFSCWLWHIALLVPLSTPHRLHVSPRLSTFGSVHRQPINSQERVKGK